MQKWRIEFYGSVDVETEGLSEADALRAGFAKLADDGSDNHLFADADPIFASADAVTEEITTSMTVEKI